MNEPPVARDGVTSDKTSVDAMPSAATRTRRVPTANGSAPLSGLIIRRQYGPIGPDQRPRVEWAIYDPQAEARGQKPEVKGRPPGFIAYSLSWTGAGKALVEIHESLRRVFETPRVRHALTQEAIDQWQGANRPMGNLRRLFWNAAIR